MVHALHEIRRALAPDGILLDLRPLLDRWPVEVSWRDEHRQVGRATDLPEPRADDEAAEAALDAGMRSGVFQPELAETFPLFYYWDTPKEMQTDLEDDWGDVIRVGEPVWSELRRTWASAHAEARVRLRVKMSIARYHPSG